MKYKITHTTIYEYGESVPMCQNIVRLTPRSLPHQTCSYHRLQVQPAPQQTGKLIDYFGNPVAVFSILQGHRRMAVSALSKVKVIPRVVAEGNTTAGWESVREMLCGDHSRPGLDNYQFCFPSFHVPHLEQLGDYARVSFTPGRPVLDAVLDLTRRIHAEFTYDPEATTVSTPISEVFEHRRGICQDLAHVQIGCLRALGLAARYVSGYLRTYPPPGSPRLVGADASHAWVSAYCGEQGWIDVDPTNDVLPGEEHVTVAWGRDYGDVCPIGGVFVGGGQHTLSVSVDVEPMEQ